MASMRQGANFRNQTSHQKASTSTSIKCQRHPHPANTKAIDPSKNSRRLRSDTPKPRAKNNGNSR